MLNILERFELKPLGAGSAGSLHLMAEALLTYETIDAKQAVTSFTYDARGRLASVTNPFEQGHGPSITYEYHDTDPTPWASIRALASATVSEERAVTTSALPAAGKTRAASSGRTCFMNGLRAKAEGGRARRGSP